MAKITPEKHTVKNIDIDDMFGGIENPDDICSSSKVAIQNNISNIKVKDNVDDDDYNISF